jgi:hypothetical protein
MLKKILFVLVLFPFMVFASYKECMVKPSYNITINDQNVHIFNKKSDMLILPDGEVIFNGKSITLGSQLQNVTTQFQQELRQHLPQLEQQTLNLLREVYEIFEKAIQTRLNNDSQLSSELKTLYKRLVNLLQQSIVTINNETYFNYKNYNNLKKDGEAIGQEIFLNVVGNSILQLNIFKNYNAIKQISKKEWKLQKPKLKAFDEYVCSVITHIDEQYQKILIYLNQLNDK